MLPKTIELLLAGVELSIDKLLVFLLELSFRGIGLLLSNDNDDDEVGVLVKSLVELMLLPLLLLLLWLFVGPLSFSPLVVISVDWFATLLVLLFN